MDSNALEIDSVKVKLSSKPDIEHNLILTVPNDSGFQKGSSTKVVYIDNKSYLLRLNTELSLEPIEVTKEI